MKLSEFQYDLPPGRIAQEPASPRDASRLMLISLWSGRREHLRFFQLDERLGPSDVLVLNSTRVFPARLRGRKKRTGGKAELLLVGPDGGDPRRWRALVRGLRAPAELAFPEGVSAALEKEQPNGEWRVRFSTPDLRAYLERHGEMPLPPYIKRPAPDFQDRERYQTVFAKTEGAVAAPTAGFHFTPALLERLKQKGVAVLEVILHVGWGTFRPVRSETVEEHSMLSENFEISAAAAAALNGARAQGKRIIAVGTTVVRTLETAFKEDVGFAAERGTSGLFIYPGYHFRAIGGLITNFHLPDSTPILLASAFYADRGRAAAAGPFALRDAYQEAIGAGYRFYSYGDAMAML